MIFSPRKKEIFQKEVLKRSGLNLIFFPAVLKQLKTTETASGFLSKNDVIEVIKSKLL